MNALDRMVPDREGCSPVGFKKERLMPERNYLLVATWMPRSVRRYETASLGFTDTFVSFTPGPSLTPIIEWLTGLEFGLDGHLYVADYAGDRIARFRHGDGGPMGDFVPAGSGGLERPGGLTFGPDGHLYVANRAFLGEEHPTGEILRFHGQTGAFLGAFVPQSANGGLKRPFTPIFGPDGHLYVCDHADDRIMRYDGATGGFLGEFVPQRSAGLKGPTGQCFGADGNLYVLNYNRLLRFDGTTGAFLDEFVGPSGGILDARTLRVGPGGNFYVANTGSGDVLVFSPTGAKVDAVKILKGNNFLPTTLVFGDLPIPLPSVPELSQRVPRWLQVIGLAVVVMAVVRVVDRVLQSASRGRR
jgi:DNA-binding beta-propeller fold protein YncE